jgi:hypothetical protein
VPAVSRGAESASAPARRRVLEAALATAALWYLGSYLVVALARVAYPYDLEWMEGGVLEHVARVLHGQPLYVPPSLEFTPYIYAPLYYYVGALFAKLFGLRLLALRMVSILASVGVLGLIAALTHARTRSRLGALVAAGLFAALFKRADAFFDLARVDSLALFFLLFALWMLLANERREVAASVLFAAAFFTKQSLLLVVLPVTLARAWSLRGPRRFACVGCFGALAAAGSLALHLRTQGWSTYYMFSLPGSHAWAREFWLRYWYRDLLAVVPIAMAAAALRLAGTRQIPAASLLERAAVLGSLLESWLSRLHGYAAANVLMPVYACLAWQTGVALGWLDGPAPAPATRRLARWACLAQLALLVFPTWRLVPTAADREAGAALVARLAAVPGPVLIPAHPHLARLAGKRTYAQQMAVVDVMRGRPRQVADALAADIRRRLRAREFAAVILDLDQDWLEPDLDASYVPAQALFAGQPTVFWPKTGWLTRPRVVYERRP